MQFHPAIPGLFGGVEGVATLTFAQDGRVQGWLLPQIHKVVHHLRRTGRGPPNKGHRVPERMDYHSITREKDQINTAQSCSLRMEITEIA